MATKPVRPVAVSADLILDAQDLDRATVLVDEWGCSVVVRELTRGEWRKATTLEADESEAYVLAHAIVEPKLTEEQAARIIAEKSYSASEKILNRVLELSGMVPGFRP